MITKTAGDFMDTYYQMEMDRHMRQLANNTRPSDLAIVARDFNVPEDVMRRYLETRKIRPALMAEGPIYGQLEDMGTFDENGLDMAYDYIMKNKDMPFIKDHTYNPSTVAKATALTGLLGAGVGGIAGLGSRAPLKGAGIGAGIGALLGGIGAHSAEKEDVSYNPVRAKLRGEQA